MFDYNAIVTKTRGMKGKLLTDEDFLLLLNQNDLPNFVISLQQLSGYQQLTFDKPVNELSRIEIEQALSGQLFEAFYKLYLFANAYQRNFLQIYSLKFINEFFKKQLKQYYDSSYQPSYGSHFKLFIEKTLDLNVEELSQAPSLKAFISQLSSKNSLGLSELDDSDKAPFDYESQIDKYLFIHLWKLIDQKMKKKDQTDLRNIIGAEIDLRNIFTIYRFKTFYPENDLKIFANLIPIYYKLSYKTILEMIDSNSDAQLLQIVNITGYHKYFQTNSIPCVESQLEAILDKLFLSITSQDPYSLVTIFNYLFDKENEIKRLITILEAIRYDKREAYIETMQLKTTM